MTRAAQVRVEGLVVTGVEPVGASVIFLPAQVCRWAQLEAGELVEVRNLATGRLLVAQLRQGPRGYVAVRGYADPDLAPGHAVVVVVGERRKHGKPAAGFCSVYRCERNRVIEIRDASVERAGVGAPVAGAGRGEGQGGVTTGSPLC